MKQILVIGAGKSATVLIDYLKEVCVDRKWRLIVADANLEQAQQKVGDCANAQVIELNVTDEQDVLTDNSSNIIYFYNT